MLLLQSVTTDSMNNLLEIHQLHVSVLLADYPLLPPFSSLKFDFYMNSFNISGPICDLFASDTTQMVIFHQHQVNLVYRSWCNS